MIRGDAVPFLKSTVGKYFYPRFSPSLSPLLGIKGIQQVCVHVAYLLKVCSPKVKNNEISCH